MHYHHQNLTDGRKALWRHGRAWYGIFGWEWSLFHWIDLWSIAFGWWGFHIYLGWFGFHVDRCRGEGGRGGRWEIAWNTHGKFLSLSSPWVDRWEWNSSDPWWKKSINLYVVDWILGKQKHEKRLIEEGRPVYVPMPEGCYKGTAKREVRTWTRRFGWFKIERDEWWIELDKSIPFSGKGENSWDCGDDGVYATGGETLPKAISNFVRIALERRADYGHDSKGTGREPVMA